MGIIDTTKNYLIKTLGGDVYDDAGFLPYYEQKDAKGVISVDGTTATQGAPTDVDFSTLYRIYEQESWVRACVDTIKRGVTANSYVFEPAMDNASPNNESYLRNFFQYPNPEDSMDDILGDVVGDLSVCGNAYVEIVKDGKGRARELYNLDPSTMKVVHDEHGKVLGYKQTIDGTKGQEVNFAPDEIIHFKLSSRGAKVYGLSPLISLVGTVDTDLKAQIYIRKYFENFGAPKALFKFKNADKEQIKRNRLYLATQVSGVENAHRNLILEGDVEYTPLSTDMKDTEVLKIRQYLRDEILAVYGVPPSKISIIESGNIGGGTGESQDKTFKMETILPLQRKIAQKLNHKLVKGVMGIFDWELQFGEVLDVDRKEEAEIHAVYVNSGIMLKNEVREQLGLEPLDDVDDKKDPEELKDDKQNEGDKPKDDKDDEDKNKKPDKEDDKDEDKKEKNLPPVLAVQKNLGIDFERFEPVRKQMSDVIESYVRKKVSEVATFMEDNNRG